MQDYCIFGAMRSPIPCIACGGLGRIETSRYGGNDPDTWLIRCTSCDGSGHERCCECGQDAVDAWIEDADGKPQVYPLCAEHMNAYVAAANDA